MSKGSFKGKFFTNAEDNALRSYKIKNLFKILPTYSILFDRECEHVIVNECPRCGRESETWEHVWICEDNDVSEYDVLIRTLIELEEYTKINNEDKYTEIKVLAKEVVNFMNDNSKILILGKLNKLRELTRGLFNNKLYKLCLNKEERELIDELWENVIPTSEKIFGWCDVREPKVWKKQTV